MHVEPMQAYELHLTDFSLEVSRAWASDVLIATGPEPTVPKAYKADTVVFSKANSESMPSHGHPDLAIELFNSTQPLWGLIYNLSEKEFDTLHFYLEVQQKHG
jgi:hypothetical protein